MIYAFKKSKKKLRQLAKSEGNNSIEVVRELIEDYIKDGDIEGYIDSVWKRIGQKLGQKKIGERDINKTIKDVRKSKTSLIPSQQLLRLKIFSLIIIPLLIPRFQSQ